MRDVILIVAITASIFAPVTLWALGDDLHLAESSGEIGRVIETITQTTTIQIDGTYEGWTSTGIVVAPGDDLLVETTGVIDYNSFYPGQYLTGPECESVWSTGFCPNSSGGGLVAKIGDNDCFCMGAYFSATVTTGGELFLAFNDSDYSGNSGYFTSAVTSTGQYVGPSYEILSVTADQEYYRSGTTTGPLTVRTVNNRSTGSASLHAELVALGGMGSFQLGDDSFSMPVGQEHVSIFQFTIPPNTSPWDFYIHATLTQDGAAVDSYSDFLFSGTPLSQTEIDAQIQELDECAILPSGGGFAVKVGALARHGTLSSPIIGGVGSAIGVMENSCREESYRAEGEDCKAEAAGTLVAVGLISLGIAAFTASVLTMGLAVPVVVATAAATLTGVGLITASVGDSAVINWLCRDQAKAFRSGEIVVGDGEKVRGLLSEISDVGDSLGFSFSTHVGVEGPVRARLSMPIGWITCDSTSIDEAAALTIAPDTLQWISVSANSSRLSAGFDSSIAPSDSLWPKRLDIEATKPGKVFVGIDVRAQGGGESRLLFYPSVDVADSTKLWVIFGPDAQAHFLNVDYDGDGAAETHLLPEGPLSPVDGPSVSLGAHRLYECYPNPFNPTTTIAYEAASGTHVRLAIYDVAGRLVRMLVDESLASSGREEAVWDGRDTDGRVAAAGVYFYRLDAGSFSDTKRMVLVK